MYLLVVLDEKRPLKCFMLHIGRVLGDSLTYDPSRSQLRIITVKSDPMPIRTLGSGVKAALRSP